MILKEIPGSRKSRVILINSTKPLFSKNALQTFSGSLFFGLGGKGLYILDSTRSHNFMLKSSWVFFKQDLLY